jgi:rubrerythrin
MTKVFRYSAGAKLAGVIYIHRISDEKFGGLAVKNFRMFRELCGEMKNVLLVTNKWGKVTPQEGEAREQQLKDKYFKAAIEKGAQLCRHHNTPESAQAILREILKNRPVVLKIQRELVEEGKDIGQTGAGAVLIKEIREVTEKYQRKIRELEDSIQHMKDEESRKEMEEEKREMQQAVEQLRKDSAEMQMTIADLLKELEGIWRCVIM